MRSVNRIFIISMLMLLLTGCSGNKAQQELMKWQLSMHKDEKRPYGAYLAYESLKYYFPGAAIEALPDGFRYSSMDKSMIKNQTGHSLMILQGLDFYISEDEWRTLKQFISKGNELIIFCRTPDSKIEDELGYYKRTRYDEEMPVPSAMEASSNKNVLSLASNPLKKYGYLGRSLHGYFRKAVHESKASSETDTSSASEETSNTDDTTTNDETYETGNISCDTLGRTADNADFIRFRLGTGHLTLHAAPLVLSNYFLLQPGNNEYLNGIWQTLPGNINKIYWQDYNKRSADSSGFSVLMRYPATRHALLIGILALLVYVLFEGKRKQRIIPVIPPLKNDSVSFVETVGRLYYNKGDHANLAGKMVQQFLEWVRMHYFLNTNLIDEHFILQLVIKSGQSEPMVRDVILMIQEIRSGKVQIDDPYLYRLYNTIQQFYKKQ